MATGWRSSYYRYRELFLNVSALYKKRADLRAFLEIILSIAAVIVFLVFALKPTALTIISLVQQINEEKVTLTNLNKKISDLQKAKVLLDQNGAYIDNIEMAVSSDPKPEVFVKQIGGLSQKHGVNLMGITINDLILIGNSRPVSITEGLTPLPDGVKEIGYSLTIKGAYTNIIGFLKDLENLRVISKVDNVTISSSVTDTERVIVAVISGRVPYIKNN